MPLTQDPTTHKTLTDVNHAASIIINKLGGLYDSEAPEAFKRED